MLNKILNSITTLLDSGKLPMLFKEFASKKIAESYTWQFDKEQRKYLTHPYINEVQRIMLSEPELYVVQSLSTLFSMTGYVPIPSAIAAMGNIYSKSIFPDLFLLTAQKIYIPIKFL